MEIGTGAYAYQWKKALLSADRGGELDIADAIQELNVYETLERNFLTGEIILIDNFNLNEFVNWQGTEYFDVEIVRPGTDDQIVFKKRFIVNKINISRKSGLASAVYSLGIVEDIFYKSYIEVNNGAYEGRPHDIISSILKDSGLEKDLKVDTPPDQGGVRYLVPSIPPLHAISKLTEISTDPDGLPYYCYSELGSDELIFKSLGEMLADVLHPEDFEFNANKALRDVSGTGEPAHSLGRNIDDYKHWNSQDLLHQVNRGTIGSEWTFLNLNQFVTRESHHSITDLYVPLKKHLPEGQEIVGYDEIAFGGLHNKKSREIVFPFLSNVYDDDMYNIHDVDGINGHNKRIKAHALRALASKDPIDIKLPGYHFFPSLEGKGNSIGKVIPLLFYNNNLDQDLETDPLAVIDYKMSGQYLVYNCRHRFGQIKYDVSITCTKFSNKRRTASDD